MAMKTALVTGASSGIGRATALEFARAGYRVFATVRRPADGEDLRRESASAVEPVVCDLQNPASIREALSHVRRGTDHLDVLVNNAGYGAAVALEDTSLEDFWAIFEVNVRGLVAMTKEALPLLGPGSTIVNVSSLAGRIAVPLMSAYCGSKFAVEGITDAMRMELFPLDIRVVAVEPGPVGHTRFSDHMIEMSERYWSRSSRYAAGYEAVRRERDRQSPGTVPAEKVARVIRRAAAARRPRHRYVTQHGQSVLLRLSKAFPRRWVDRATMKYVGFDAEGGKP